MSERESLERGIVVIVVVDAVKAIQRQVQR